MSVFLKNVIGFLFLLFGLLIYPSVTNASDYYVATTGNDSSTGTQQQPFKTINKAVSVIVAGDRIFVGPGSYPPFTITKSGTSSAPIIVQGNQSKVSGGENAIRLFGNYINVSGFETHDTDGHSVLISGKNIKFSDFIVRDSVNDNKNGESCSGSGNWGSGLKIYVGAENIILENGSIFRNCGEGLAVTRGVNVTVSNLVAYDNFSVNFYLDNSKNVILQQSLAYCTDDTNYYRDGKPAAGILIGEEEYSGWGAQLENITVRNNIVSGCSGIIYYGSEVSPGGLKGAQVFHNTIHNVFGTRGIHFAPEPDNRDIFVRNNITAGTLSTGTGITASNNLISTTYLNAPNPLNPSSFMPAINSSAINAGVNTNVFNDFAGNTRPQGSAPDIGAYEYAGGGSSVTPTSAPTLLGDLNSDGSVNNSDYQIFVEDFGKTGSVSDINKSGKVDIFDYSILVENYGKSI